MSYQPTYEDALYLLTEEWEAFDNGNYADGNIRIIAARRHGGEPVNEAAVAEGVYRAYLDSGAEPLTRSPIPEDKVLADDPYYQQLLDPNKSALAGSASMYEQNACDEGPDTAFGATCVACVQDDACCLKAGVVSDKKDETRKVEWPPVNGATTLLVIAELQGLQLLSDVLVSWEGEESCLAGLTDKPCLITGGLEDGRQQLTERASEVSVAYEQHLSLALALGNFIPRDVALALFAFDSLMSLNILNNQGGRATFQPSQCCPGKDVRNSLTVIPYPCITLESDFTLAVETSFMTHGVSAQVEAKGRLSGQYGRYELTLEKGADATANSQDTIPRENDAPGLIGIIVNTIQTMNRYFDMGSTSTRSEGSSTNSERGIRPDSSKMGSGIVISKSLTFKAEGFKLAAVEGSPDLEIQVGELDSTLSLGITGRIDLIEAVAAVLLSPANLRNVQNARARIAAGENVNATIEGYLQLSATGSLTHKVNGGSGDSIATYRIPASGETSEAAFNGISQDFDGELKIIGVAELKLHIEGRVFVLSAQVGVRGTIHTSWAWEVRSRDGVREKRYAFEGVKVSGEAYAEVKVSKGDDANDDSMGIDMQAGLADARQESEVQASDIFSRVESAIERSERQANEDIEGFNPNPRGDDGNGKTIWGPDPEEPEWVPF